MSNVPEEGSKVAISAITALKGNPLCLALLVLVGILFGIMYFTQSKRAVIVQELIERCVEPRGLKGE